MDGADLYQPDRGRQGRPHGRPDRTRSPAAASASSLAAGTSATWPARRPGSQIVDRATGGWGHINVDQIVLTDLKPPRTLHDVSEELTLERRYLHFPVKTGAKKCRGGAACGRRRSSANSKSSWPTTLAGGPISTSGLARARLPCCGLTGWPRIPPHCGTSTQADDIWARRGGLPRAAPCAVPLLPPARLE